MGISYTDCAEDGFRHSLGEIEPLKETQLSQTETVFRDDEVEISKFCHTYRCEIELDLTKFDEVITLALELRSKLQE